MDVLIQMKRWQIISHYTYQQKPIYGVLSTKNPCQLFYLIESNYTIYIQTSKEYGKRLLE